MQQLCLLKNTHTIWNSWNSQGFHKPKTHGQTLTPLFCNGFFSRHASCTPCNTARRRPEDSLMQTTPWWKGDMDLFQRCRKSISEYIYIYLCIFEMSLIFLEAKPNQIPKWSCFPNHPQKMYIICIHLCWTTIFLWNNMSMNCLLKVIFACQFLRWFASQSWSAQGPGSEHWLQDTRRQSRWTPQVWPANNAWQCMILPGQQSAAQFPCHAAQTSALPPSRSADKRCCHSKLRVLSERTNTVAQSIASTALTPSPCPGWAAWAAGAAARSGTLAAAPHQPCGQDSTAMLISFNEKRLVISPGYHAHRTHWPQQCYCKGCSKVFFNNATQHLCLHILCNLLVAPCFTTIAGKLSYSKACLDGLGKLHHMGCQTPF